MDGSLKRFPLSPPPSLPAPLSFFFFSYSSNNRILSSSPPPDLTYLNPILNLANAYLFAMAIRGMYASFARYSVAETSTGIHQGVLDICIRLRGQKTMCHRDVSRIRKWNFESFYRFTLSPICIFLDA